MNANPPPDNSTASYFSHFRLRDSAQLRLATTAMVAMVLVFGVGSPDPEVVMSATGSVLTAEVRHGTPNADLTRAFDDTLSGVLGQVPVTYLAGRVDLPSAPCWVAPKRSMARHAPGPNRASSWSRVKGP